VDLRLGVTKAMPTSLAAIWIFLPYFLSHAEALHGPALAARRPVPLLCGLRAGMRAAISRPLAIST